MTDETFEQTSVVDALKTYGLALETLTLAQYELVKKADAALGRRVYMAWIPLLVRKKLEATVAPLREQVQALQFELVERNGRHAAQLAAVEARLAALESVHAPAGVDDTELTGTS